MLARSVVMLRLLLGFSLAAALVAPADAAPFFRRWLDNGKVFTCEPSGGGVHALLNNQDVEFSGVPAFAQFTIHYIDNGVDTTDGPFTVEQTSGTHAYGAFAEAFAAYPFTFRFRLDTLIGGVVVYRSTISVTCTGDAVVPVTPVNEDLSASITAYRRWVDDKTFTCGPSGGQVGVTFSNQNVEVFNPDGDAQYVLHYIDNGVATPSGPFAMEPTGIHAYAPFLEVFPSYPFVFQFRIDTLVGGAVVYQSAIETRCSGDGPAAVLTFDGPPRGPDIPVPVLPPLLLALLAALLGLAGARAVASRR